VNLLIQNISNEFNQTMFTHFEGVRDENHPVNYVTYYEVELWLDGLNKLSRLQNTHIHKELEILFPGHSYGAKYRLPTNAEWELTARLGGVAEGNYSFGTSESEVPNYVIYNKNSVSNPEPIGSKKPVFYNGKPIYDIQGNVWVWTSDWYSEQLTGGLDPKGPATGTLRRIRGGNWGNDEKIISLNNSQFSFNPQGCSGGGGFRIVRGIN
jgi:formylglycine-generating enzyme required for sulfatase activity